MWDEPGALGRALCFPGQLRVLCVAGAGPWETCEEEKASCLAQKSKGEPQVRHVVLLVIAWNQDQVCHPPSSSEEVPSVLVLGVSVRGQAVPYAFIVFPKSSKEIRSQMNASRVLCVSLPIVCCAGENPTMPPQL